jgi:hypothetical protein
MEMHIWCHLHTNFNEFCLPMEAYSPPKKHMDYNLKYPWIRSMKRVCSEQKMAARCNLQLQSPAAAMQFLRRLVCLHPHLSPLVSLPVHVCLPPGIEGRRGLICERRYEERSRSRGAELAGELAALLDKDEEERRRCRGRSRGKGIWRGPRGELWVEENLHLDWNLGNALKLRGDLFYFLIYKSKTTLKRQIWSRLTTYNRSDTGVLSDYRYKVFPGLKTLNPRWEVNSVVIHIYSLYLLFRIALIFL